MLSWRVKLYNTIFTVQVNTLLKHSSFLHRNLLNSYPFVLFCKLNPLSSYYSSAQTGKVCFIQRLPFPCKQDTWVPLRYGSSRRDLLTNNVRCETYLNMKIGKKLHDYLKIVDLYVTSGAVMERVSNSCIQSTLNCEYRVRY